MAYQRVTQREVAKAAGVSQATVSMVMSRSQAQAIPLQTFDRVMQIARELGYVPNRQAQALKTKRTRTLACVVPDVTNPFYPSLVRGVQTIADAAGYDVIVLNTDGSAERERRFLDWSLRGTIDGVVGVFFKIRATDFAAIVRASIAVVRIEAAAKHGGPLPIDNLFVDNVAAAAEATRYLVGRGHRRIAMIVGSGGPERNRIDGYLQALGEVGHSSQVVTGGEFNQEGGYRANSRRSPGWAPADRNLRRQRPDGAWRHGGDPRDGTHDPRRHRADGFRRYLRRQRGEPAALDRQPAPVFPGPGRHGNVASTA